VNKKIDRNYLEIYSLKDLVESSNPSDELLIELINPPDFQLNKFFYKNIGKNHRWVDRLGWNEKQWIEFTTNKNLRTYVLKKKNDLAGYFELLIHEEKKEVEIAYLGLLEEYQNQKLGSYLLSSAIKNSFFFNPKRVWVHTCSLDHKNALSNYLSRGMKIFMKETVHI
jgi:GNAT superfamily N-acetyltransferase|tara:strand:- start:68 stop:571 length:504 start_codon:yes stop_codon:yes gene_type:complete